MASTTSTPRLTLLPLLLLLLLPLVLLWIGAVGAVPAQAKAATADEEQHEEEEDVARCKDAEGKLVEEFVARRVLIPGHVYCGVNVVYPVTAGDYPPEQEHVEHEVECLPYVVDVADFLRFWRHSVRAAFHATLDYEDEVLHCSGETPNDEEDGNVGLQLTAAKVEST